MVQGPTHSRGTIVPQDPQVSQSTTSSEGTSSASSSATNTTTSTTSTTSGRSVSSSQDRFETAPRPNFINQLVSLDRNADGRVDTQEWTVGRALLERLGGDGRQVDPSESSLLSLLQSQAQTADTVFSYRVRDGKLAISIPGGQTETPVMRVWDHQLRERGGLPEVLQERVLSARGTETVVRHGTDPGDFYCEHMFFGAQIEAAQPQSSVRTNAEGEPLVGFLHLPSDPYASHADSAGYTQESRHTGTRQVVGAALRGYYEQIHAQQPDQPVRILLTGYDTFGSIQNNPTGDFVAHRENLDASMRRAFGDTLLSPTGTLVSSEGEPLASSWRYEVRDAQTGEPRDIIVTTAVFPVSDPSIDPNSSSSVQNLMRRSESQAVLSMGVSPWSEYRVEHHADSGGLRRTPEHTTHKEGAADTVVLRDNYALARAIQLGSQPR